MSSSRMDTGDYNMGGRVPPCRSRTAAPPARKIQSDDQIADVGPGGPVCTRSPAAASAALESARARHRSASRPPREMRATVSPSTTPPASSVGPSVPSVPAASRARSGCPVINLAAARARCWLRPPRPGCRRELQRRLPAPDTDLSLAELQLVSEANGQTDRIVIKHPARRATLKPRPGRHREPHPRPHPMEARSCVAPVRRPARGPHESRPDDARIVARHVGDEQRARLPALQARGEASALDARNARPPGVQLTDRHAFGQTLGVDPREVRERHPVLEHFDEAGGAPGNQKQRLRIRRQLVHPAQQTCAGLERAVIRDRMSALVYLDARQAARFGETWPSLVISSTRWMED